MRYTFREEFYDIDTVMLEFYDQKEDLYEIAMKYDVGKREWFCEYEENISKYKFVVNNIIRLNDPMAQRYVYDDNWEVWSVTDRYIYKENQAKIVDYVTTDGIIKGVKKTTRKSEYVYSKPLDIYTAVELQDIKGLHSITYICFQPDGSIYMIEEDSVGQFATEICNYEIIFKNHISRIQGRNAEGMWIIQVYLDGRCIVKDYFVVKTKIVTNMAFIDCKI